MTTLRGLTLEKIPVCNRLSSSGFTVTWDGTRLTVIAEPGKSGLSGHAVSAAEDAPAR